MFRWVRKLRKLPFWRRKSPIPDIEAVQAEIQELIARIDGPEAPEHQKPRDRAQPTKYVTVDGTRWRREVFEARMRLIKEVRADQQRAREARQAGVDRQIAALSRGAVVRVRKWTSHREKRGDQARKTGEMVL